MNDKTWVEIDKDDPRATATIVKGAFGVWHMVDDSGRHYRPFPGNLTSALRTLKSEGYLRVDIRRGGVQRQNVETRYL